jgi:hypothetical protein
MGKEIPSGGLGVFSNATADATTRRRFRVGDHVSPRC